jgi:hypothetical protein
MGKIAQVLYPKREELVGKRKPSVLILSSPFDKITAAVRYTSVVDVATGRGYTCLNKGPIEFFDEKFAKSIKPSQSKTKELTIWLEAHGAPGWLFGKEASAEIELANTIKFADYIRDIEKHTGLKVTNIILSCCYSANEFLHPETQNHFYSPARLLSKLLPDVDVMGFVGQNASAKGTSIYKLDETGRFVPKVATLEEIAIVFRNGKTLELSASKLYCDLLTIPYFVSEACGVDDPAAKYNPFKTTTAIDKLALLPPKSPDRLCYGEWQMVSISEPEGAPDLDETLTITEAVAKHLEEEEVEDEHDIEDILAELEKEFFDSSTVTGTGVGGAADSSHPAAIGGAGTTRRHSFFPPMESPAPSTSPTKELGKSSSGYLKIK